MLVFKNILRLRSLLLILLSLHLQHNDFTYLTQPGIPQALLMEELFMAFWLASLEFPTLTRILWGKDMLNQKISRYRKPVYKAFMPCLWKFPTYKQMMEQWSRDQQEIYSGTVLAWFFNFLCSILGPFHWYHLVDESKKIFLNKSESGESIKLGHFYPRT